MSVVFVDLNLDDPAIHPFLHDVLTEYVPSYMATQVNLSQQAHQIRAQEILDYATADLVFMFTFYSHLRRHPSGPELRIAICTWLTLRMPAFAGKPSQDARLGGVHYHKDYYTKKVPNASFPRTLWQSIGALPAYKCKVWDLPEGAPGVPSFLDFVKAGGLIDEAHLPPFLRPYSPRYMRNPSGHQVNLRTETGTLAKSTSHSSWKGWVSLDGEIPPPSQPVGALYEQAAHTTRSGLSFAR